MKRSLLRNITLGFVLLTIGGLVWAALLPVVNASWKHTITISGSIKVADLASQTPSATLTPLPTLTPTPTPTEAVQGTSLKIAKTAQGFYDRKANSNDFTYGVRGEICVTNTGDKVTDHLAITDQVEYKDAKGVYKPLAGAALAVRVEKELAPRETTCYAYRIEFDPGEYKVFRNSAQAVIRNHSGWLPGSKNCPGTAACPYGPVVKAAFTLPFEPTRTPTEKPQVSTATAIPPTAIPPTAQPSATQAAPTATKSSGSSFLPTVLPTRTATSAPLPALSLTPTVHP